MSVRLIVRAEAEAEMADAFDWYEERVPGLGSDFLLCMDAGINKILRSPLQYPLIYKNVRRALIRRFPYEVFFVQERDRIVVLSVSHFKRNPKRWQGGI